MQENWESIQELWTICCEENRLKILMNHEEAEVLFLNDSKLKMEGLDNIWVCNREQYINIKGYDFIHNLSIEPVQVYTFIDAFFFAQFKNDKLYHNMLNDEQTLLMEKTLKWLSKWNMKNEYAPFFYTLRHAKFGLEKAKASYNSEKGVTFDDYRKHLINKSLATGVNKLSYYKNRDEMLI